MYLLNQCVIFLKTIHQLFFNKKLIKSKLFVPQSSEIMGRLTKLSKDKEHVLPSNVFPVCELHSFTLGLRQTEAPPALPCTREPVYHLPDHRTSFRALEFHIQMAPSVFSGPAWVFFKIDYSTVWVPLCSSVGQGEVVYGNFGQVWKSRLGCSTL